MTKFTINVENVKRLSTLSGQSKELISLTKPIFCPTQNELSINLYSTSVAMSFAVDIQNFETTDTEEINFFSMNIDDFNSTLATVSAAYTNEVIIEADKSQNKITFSNPTTGTKIERAVFNVVVTMDEVKASITAVEDMKAQYLTDPIAVTVTNEVSNFFESAAKFMNLLKVQNTIVLDKDSAKYADQLIVLDKKLSKSVCDSPVYFKRKLYESVKPFLKLSDELTVYLTKDCNLAFFESKDLGYKAAIALEAERWAYPTEDDLKMGLPDESQQVIVQTTKSAIKSAFVPFNNTFKSSGDNWNWKATTIEATKENLDDGKLVLSYHDFTGAAQSVIPVTVQMNSENEKGGNIIVSIQIIEELLNLITEEDIKLTYNSLEPSTVHGAIVLFESDTVKATCIKFNKPQN